MNMKNFIIIFAILLTGCSSRGSKDSLINFSFPIQPADDEIVIYVASHPAYVSDWAYFSLELSGEYKILNFGDCNYFIVKANHFTLRSKRNVTEDPVASLKGENLRLGSTYYFERDNNGKSAVSHFKEVTAKEVKPICAEFGFGRVINNPPNERWGKNDLQ
ncbi:hypothetical protein [Arsukibacterium sp.]|uniref:hypothetical protein n=1 Tax=Arsukibacterium sp. TaxID=1977258 RepID=UPI002FDA7A42